MTVINPKSISGINSITTGSGSDDLLTIHNNSGAERFRVDGDGNTRITSGIVTTVSVGAVSSVGAISGDISIDDKIIHNGDTNTSIRFPAADTITVETGGSERARMTSAGRLLLGTSVDNVFNGGRNARFQQEGLSAADSAFALCRNSNDANPPYISLGKSRGTDYASNTAVQNGDAIGCIEFNAGDGSGAFNAHATIQAKVDGAPGNSDAPGRLEFYTTPDGGSTTPVERLRINSSGKVGINSTAPDGMLAIEHTSSAPNLTMRNHPAAGPYTNEYGLELRHAYGSVKHGALIHTQEADLGRRSLDISDSDGVFCTFVMGRVGINTTRPTGNLDIRAKTDDNPSIRIYRPSGGGDVGSLAFASSQGTNAYINWRGGGGTKGLQFFTSTSGNDGSTTEKVRITEDLNILDGNLVIGTNGHGIDFSATSGPDTGASGTSELLDDYEEGTWSGLMMDGNGSNTTITSVTAKYIKVGKLVHCYYNITEDDNGKTGTMRFYQLPFTTSNTTLQVTGTWWLDESSPSAGDAVGGSHYLVPNSNQTGGFTYPTTEWQQANHRYMQYADWDNARPIYGSFTYHTQD